MGYNNGLGKISKENYNKLKKIKLKEYKDDDVYYDFYNSIYDFGKYVSFNPPNGSLENYFEDIELQNYYNEDQEINVASKEFLEYVIYTYKGYIKSYYENILKRSNDLDLHQSIESNMDYEKGKMCYKFSDNKLSENEEVQSLLLELLLDTKYKNLEWDLDSIIDLKNNDTLTHSWKYEYTIFNLVHIYKTFNWDNDMLIYYGG